MAFGHTYLTEPSMLPYIEQIAPNDRFIIPVGPLALFLHEWISLLSTPEAWKDITELFTPAPEVPEEVRNKTKKYIIISSMEQTVKNCLSEWLRRTAPILSRSAEMAG